jgi:hypothetical protein
MSGGDAAEAWRQISFLLLRCLNPFFGKPEPALDLQLSNTRGSFPTIEL